MQKLNLNKVLHTQCYVTAVTLMLYGYIQTLLLALHTARFTLNWSRQRTHRINFRSMRERERDGIYTGRVYVYNVYTCCVHRRPVWEEGGGGSSDTRQYCVRRIAVFSIKQIINVYIDN